MGLSVVVRRMLRASAITTLALVTAFGVGAVSAAARQAPAGGASLIPSAPILAGVSCPAVSRCLVVGEAVSGPGFVPLAGTWNGSKWRWLAQPPEPAADSGLGAVTCLSATRCIAVGNTDATGSTGQGAAFGEEWDGASWQMMAPMAGPTFTSALGLSCVTAAYCVAVGGSGRSLPAAHAVAEFWNGTSWTRLRPVIPAGAKALTFDGVSCASKSHCLAVGSYRAHSDEFAVAESWDGSTWRMQAVPAGISAFAGVSCPRPDLCLAVAPEPAVTLWNGSKWRTLTVPNPREFDPSLIGVTCASATSCIAVGGSVFGAIADAWTGGTSLTALSFPSSAGGIADLSAISCRRSSGCLAIGSPLGEFTAGGNVVVTWNGSRWRAIREN
jgi:hypothetical protein